MKISEIFRTAAYTIAGVTFLMSCSNHDTKITVKDTDNEYSFYARYNGHRTPDVYEYLNKALAPQKLFSNAHGHIEANVKLADLTEIELDAEQGDLKIRMNKDKNSPASYRRMKKMYADLGELMKD